MECQSSYTWVLGLMGQGHQPCCLWWRPGACCALGQQASHGQSSQRRGLTWGQHLLLPLLLRPSMGLQRDAMRRLRSTRRSRGECEQRVHIKVGQVACYPAPRLDDFQLQALTSSARTPRRRGLRPANSRLTPREDSELSSVPNVRAPVASTCVTAL